MRSVALVAVTGIAVALVAAHVSAAPPRQITPPQPPVLARPDLQKIPGLSIPPLSIVGAKVHGTAPYTGGQVSYDVTIRNISAAPVTTNLTGKRADKVWNNLLITPVQVTVPANADAVITLTDPAPMNTCNPTSLTLGLEDGPAKPLTVTPSCTFSASYPTNPPPPSWNPVNGVSLSGVRLYGDTVSCKSPVVVNVKVTNRTSTVAKNLKLNLTDPGSGTLNVGDLGGSQSKILNITGTYNGNGSYMQVEGTSSILVRPHPTSGGAVISSSCKLAVALGK